MRDYEEKVLNIMNSAKDDIKAQLDKAYKNGYEDGKKTSYNCAGNIEAEYARGLNDAWECVKKIFRMNISERDAIFAEFGKSTRSVIMDMSASEVMSKIKEYEEQQKQDAIQVGDEVMTKLGTKGIVITDIPSEDGDISVWLPTCTHVQMYPVKGLVKTGRHFDQIAEVLERGESE